MTAAPCSPVPASSWSPHPRSRCPPAAAVARPRRHDVDLSTAQHDDTAVRGRRVPRTRQRAWRSARTPRRASPAGGASRVDADRAARARPDPELPPAQATTSGSGAGPRHRVRQVPRALARRHRGVRAVVHRLGRQHRHPRPGARRRGARRPAGSRPARRPASDTPHSCPRHTVRIGAHRAHRPGHDDRPPDIRRAIDPMNVRLFDHCCQPNGLTGLMAERSGYSARERGPGSLPRTSSR